VFASVKYHTKENIMTIKSAFLGGVAVAAVVTFGVSGAAAQSNDARYGYGPPVSTPAEMQQTDQLNEQAINGTTQPPAVLNGEAPAQNQNAPVGYPGDASYQGAPDNGGYGQAQAGEMQNGAPSAGSDAQYEQQQQQYQDQMQRYGQEQNNYGKERENYAQNVRAYDLAQYAWSYPAPYTYHYGDAYGLQPLYLMAEPSQQLWQVPVEGPGGSWVGRVRNVQIAPDGRPWRIEVALNRRVSVWVRPGDLRFDPDQHVLYTDLTRGQLWMMPGATIESAPM
jgi:hypothetical protein